MKKVVHAYKGSIVFIFIVQTCSWYFCIWHWKDTTKYWIVCRHLATFWHFLLDLPCSKHLFLFNICFQSVIARTYSTHTHTHVHTHQLRVTTNCTGQRQLYEVCAKLSVLFVARQNILAIMHSKLHWVPQWYRMQKLYSSVVVFTVLVLKWLCLHM